MSGCVRKCWECVGCVGVVGMMGRVLGVLLRGERGREVTVFSGIQLIKYPWKGSWR